MSRVSRKIHDKRLLKLIGRYLRSGVMIDGNVYPTKVGMPQGGPLSPLLSNVVLDELDKELEYRGHCFARYCDDFVILVKSQRAGDRVMHSITQFIERKLKLKINSRKSSLCQEGCESNRKRIPEFHLHRKESSLGPEVSGPIQVQDTQIDQSSLGCLNATPVTQTGAIYPGLDGIFPIIGILPTISPAGSMDTSANPLLFSEAMAQAENPFQESGQVRR